MSKPSLPNPHEPFVDLQTGKVSDVWYRYLSQELTQTNALTDVVGGLSTGTTGLTAVAFSSFAVQADQEATTAATAVVTPSVQQYHPSAAKAWGYITFAGTVGTVAANYGVSGVGSVSTTGIVVNLSPSFSGSSYAIIAGQTAASTATNVMQIIAQASSTFTCFVQNTSANGVLPQALHFACYGDQ